MNLFARRAMLALVALALLSGRAHANQVAPIDTAEAVKGDAAWGVYGDLAGKTWLIVDNAAFNSFYIVKFHWQQDQLVDDTTLYTVAGKSTMQLPSRSVLHRLPDGRLQGEDTKVSGVVASDGSIVFATRSAFGREKIVSTIRRVDGKIVSVFAEAPKRPFVYNQITDDEIPGLLAQWNERLESRNRERAAASQARWDQFNAALQGVTAALSEVQTVTHAQAFASGSGIAPAAVPATVGNSVATPPAPAAQAPGQPLRFESNAQAASTQMLGFCNALKLGGFEGDKQAVIYVSSVGPVDYAFGQPIEPLKDAYAAKTGVPGLAVVDCMVSTDRAMLERKRQEAIDNRGYPNARHVMTDL